MRIRAVVFSIVLSIIAATVSSCTTQDPREQARTLAKARYAEVYAKSRTLQEVQEGFDRNKEEIARVFEGHPGLQPGLIAVGLTIQPDGTVSECSVTSSTFSDPDLESQILETVRKITFGSRNVPAFSYSGYPINYFPPGHAL